MEIPPAYLAEKCMQRVVASAEWTNQQPASLHREIDRRSLFHLSLGGEGPRDPKSQTLTPFLNLRLHARDLLPDMR
jgi:hypothetical protein